MKKCLAIMLSLICIPNIVNAASSCTYAEQNELYQKAANIKPKVEIVQETLHFNDGDVDADIFQISVLNITEDFYVVITNNYNSETKTLTYSDVTDGVATYTWRNIDAVTNFTYKV